MCTFFWCSNHQEEPFFSLIFTRRRPISSQGRGLIDFFFFSFNIPLELAFLSAPWNKTLKRRRKKKLVSSLSGEAQKSAERARKETLLWGYRKVKIINVDSIEALSSDKGGKTLHFGSADPHSVINSFKEAEIKSEQHGSREGEGAFSLAGRPGSWKGLFSCPSSLPSLPQKPLSYP